MKNNGKTLLIALAVVVVLGGAMAALLLTNPTDEAAPGGEDTSSAVGGVILKGSAEDVTRMAVENQNGRYAFVPDPDKPSGFTIEGMETQELQDGFVQYATEDGYQLEYIRDFGERETLAEYGLETPAASYTVFHTDGSEKTVNIGLAVPGEEGLYYVALSGTRRVYSANIYALLLSTPLDYINTTLVAAPESSGTTGGSETPSEDGAEGSDGIQPDQIRIGGTRWPEAVWMTKNENYGKKGRTFSDVSMVMREPIYAACADEGWETLSGQLRMVTAARAVSVDVSAEGLKAYGLDKPSATIRYTLGEKEISLLAGRTVQAETDSGTETRYYLMAEEGQAIFEIAQDSVSAWTDGDFYQLTATLARTYALEDIERIRVEMAGETYMFTYETTEGEPDEDGNVTQTGVAKADGKTLTVTNFEKYFALLSTVRSEGMPERPVSGQPDLTVTLYYRSAFNAAPSIIRFYPMGDRRYHVVYNDEDCYVTVQEGFVENLKENTKRCARDETVLG